MALVVIRCPCGCVFRRDETSEKVCPSCNAFHAPGEGLAEGLSPTMLRSLLVLSSSLLVGLLLVLVALLGRRTPAPASPAPPPKPSAAPSPVKSAPALPAPPKVVAIPLPPLPPQPPPLEELQGVEVARAYRLAARANLGSLVKAVLIHTDAKEAAAHLGASLQTEHEELVDLLRRHSRRAEFRALPQRIEPADEVIAFSTVGLDPQRPGPFVDEIKVWFRTLQPGAATLVAVRRGAANLILPVYAPTLKEDVASLIRLTGVGPGGANDVRIRRPLPAALLSEVARRLQQLHPSHRDALPDDLSSRTADLLRFAVGNDDDETFLRVRILDLALRPLEEDYARLLKTSADLEARAFTAVLPDVLVFKSGRRLCVRLLAKEPERVHVRLPVGEARFLLDELASIEQGQAAVADLQAAYAAGRNDVPSLLKLLPRVREPRWKLLRDLVCTRILVLDPVHDIAWSELGFAPKLSMPTLRDQDVVHLHDGTRRAGLLVTENPDILLLETPVRGPRGEVLGMNRLSWARRDVLRVDRMSEQARENLRIRSTGRESDRQRLEADLTLLTTAPAELQGVRGLSIAGTHVELFSTAPDRTTRETARFLEAAFAAFHREFDVRQAPARRVQVQLLGDRTKIEAARQEGGIPVSSSYAQYRAKDNLIVALDPSQGSEARAVLEDIRRADQEVERQLQSLKAEEARHEAQRKALRQSLVEQEATRRRTEGPAAFDAWKERQSAALRQAEQELDDQFGRYRREARRNIEGRQEASIRGQAALSTLTGALRTALIREAFHAFATRSLWAGLDPDRLPRWLPEGFAAYFETAVLDVGEFRHGAPPARLLAMLQEKARTGTLPPAAEVLRARPHVFAAEASCAQAWLIAHWMASRGLDREAHERYTKAVVGGADPAEALGSVIGLAGPALDAALRLHLDRLPGSSR